MLILGSLTLFTSLTSLSILSLSCNKFYGSIPDSIAKISKLQQLSLSYNKFSGTIPSSIGSLRKLRRLRLSFNHFDGQIPYSIGNLKRLRELSLAGNKFYGILPNSLAKLNRLTELYLSYNNFVSVSNDMYCVGDEVNQFIRCYCSSTVVAEFVPRPIKQKYNLGAFIMIFSTGIGYLNLAADIWAVNVFARSNENSLMALTMFVLILAFTLQLLKPSTTKDQRLLVVLQLDLFVECWRCIQHGLLSKSFFQVKLIDLLVKSLPNSVIHIYSVFTLYDILSTDSLLILVLSTCFSACGASWLLGSCSLRAVNFRDFFLEVVYNLVSVIFRIITLAMIFSAHNIVACAMLATEALIRLYLTFNCADFRNEKLSYSVIQAILMKTILFMSTDSAVKDRKTKTLGFAVTAVFGWVYALLFFLVDNPNTEAVKESNQVMLVLVAVLIFTFVVRFSWSFLRGLRNRLAYGEAIQVDVIEVDDD